MASSSSGGASGSLQRPASPPGSADVHFSGRGVSPATAAMSIQSLLAASQRIATPRSQGSDWDPPRDQAGEMMYSTSHITDSLQQSQDPTSADTSQTTIGKRKREHTIAEDYGGKVARTTQEHANRSSGSQLQPAHNVTTVSCLHAAVAQKSYGSEKRFLCPPPVVRIESPMKEMRVQELAMTIVTENNERSSDQRAVLDDSMQASFKYLHVGGSSKSKTFQLVLDISEPSRPDGGSGGAGADPNRPWATFDSAPVTIISKPSKKTAKTRNITSCILIGGPVSLFNRINSQTVRTKYMTIERGRLSASNLSWSAFNVNVTRSFSESLSPSEQHNAPSTSTARPPPSAAAGPQALLYGSEIILTDPLTGISSDPLIVMKVDRGRICVDDGGPVSQMQKIALQHVNENGTRYYLSAANMLHPGGVNGYPVSGAPGSSGAQMEGRSPHALNYQVPRVTEEIRNGISYQVDEVDDYLCWTIVGISKFQYTFFDSTGSARGIPSTPITPFPSLISPPVYRPATHTLELTLSNFIHSDPHTNVPDSLEVWLGELGPLRQRVYQSNPATLPAGQSGGPSGPPGVRTGADSNKSDSHSQPSDPALRTFTSILPNGVLPNSPQSAAPTILILDMPPLADIIRAIHGSSAGLPPGLGPQALQSSQAPRAPSPLGSEKGKEREVPSAGDRNPDAYVISDDMSAPTLAGPESAHPTGHPPHSDLTSGSSHGNPIPTHTSTMHALPILFVRPSVGIGHHSGRSVVVENVLHGSSGAGSTGEEWLASAQVAAAAEGGLHGWTLRTM
ncbi:hypothetical protein BOTBODRAFT_37170 [Botryobasidium botryosum FD-172 SS1]|uniref:Beta-trefoil DNA-binding domain-containing protein n=1 Tax=Botryobasidium botryosum (strain FD-172 SS1) TaxID=930990 RepID=A0A067M0J6_BOTB1|nr:hypothetical protein BOTBODRAFT_37170 [Botryobasidium botryosum FD-172 SS1]